MPIHDENRETNAAQQDRFLTTHWSIVIRAGRREPCKANEALITLCNSYWYPLYAYVRWQGYAPEDAQDLTQGFFAKLLEKNYIQHADKERGKFRSFLITSIKHFLSNERDRNDAKKRGGGQTPISLDLDDAESRYQHEPSDPMTAERLYERRWALTLLDHALARLEAQYEAEGKRGLFDSLKGQLTREKGATPYRELANDVGLTEGALKTAVHRLRKRYREILEDEIAQTVSDPRDVKDELKQLFSALG